MSKAESPEIRRVKIYFDGNKTPEAVTCSYVLIDDLLRTNKQPVGFQKEETIKLPDETTVPQAEYQGLINALSAMSDKKIELEIFGDSQLAVKQILGEWECKNAELRILRSQVRNLLNEFDKWSIQWVPREQNKAK